MGYFKILAAIPGFFISAWLLMLLWGVFADDIGVQTISYSISMLITITLWLVVAPLTAVGSQKYNQ